jgi:hypothetical protein
MYDNWIDLGAPGFTLGMTTEIKAELANGTLLLKVNRPVVKIPTSLLAPSFYVMKL